MRARYLIILVIALLSSVIIGMNSSGAVGAGEDGYTVGEAAYTIGTVNVSPVEGCVGDTISMTGIYHLANAYLVVSMAGVADDGQIYYAILGNTTSDASGTWSFTFQIPATVTRLSDGAVVDMIIADWPVGATGVQDSAIYDSYTYLNVLGSCYTQQAASVPTSTATTLPKTGSTLDWILTAALAMLFAGNILLLCAARRPASRHHL